MSMWGRRGGVWLVSVGCVIAMACGIVRVPTCRAQAVAMAQAAPADSSVHMLSEPPVVRPQDVPQMSRRGGGNPKAPGAGRGGRRAKMLGHLMTLLTLVGAAGAVYAYREIRRLRDAHARLQDTIAGQARQLAEIKAMLEGTPRT